MMFRFLLCSLILVTACAAPPIKRYYLLNYIPEPPKNRISENPYPVHIRIKEFGIEEAYKRPQIVFRKSPYELQYYFYRVWAVKPTRMITDIIYRHFLTTRLVSTVSRRFDEASSEPHYQLEGHIEAIEEYDSEDIWFAHLAIRFTLSRYSDGKILYSRLFDNRKKVFDTDPEQVIKEMTAIMEFMANQMIMDIDKTIAGDLGYEAQ